METIERKPFVALRHGQTDWNAGGLCVGQADVHLNRMGIAQANAAAAVVAAYRPSAIYHSPLERAAHTAAIVGKELGCSLFEVADLREASFGIMEGQIENEGSNDLVTDWLKGSVWDGAESFVCFKERVIGALNLCLSQAVADRPLIVAHSGVFMAVSAACDLTISDLEHCRPYEFAPDDAGWTVKLLDL